MTKDKAHEISRHYNHSHDRGQITRPWRNDELLTQVVHTTAYSYTLVADFGEKKKMDKTMD